MTRDQTKTHIISLQLLLAPIGLLVLPPERNGQARNQDQSQQAGGNARIQTRLVAGKLILLAEDQGASNTADTTEGDKGSGAEGTLPLTADVVGLVRHGSRNVGVGASSDQENAKVADLGARREAHDGDTNDGQQGVSGDDGAADLVLVADPGAGEHDEAGEGIGGSDEALGLGDVEAHAAVQDDGQEEGQRVGDGGGVEEDHGVRPHLPVQARGEVLADDKLLRDHVAAVGLHARAHPLAVAGGEEGPGGAGRVGEVNEKPVAGDTQDAGQDALDDEDPAPARQVSQAVHLHQAVGENAGEGGGDATGQVED